MRALRAAMAATHEEVAAVMRLSAETVRVIERDALVKLRKNREAARLMAAVLELDADTFEAALERGNGGPGDGEDVE